jgi:hypothetical protein
LSDYSNYNGPYTILAPSGNVVMGKPDIKFGRRVVQRSLKYEFCPPEAAGVRAIQ